MKDVEDGVTLRLEVDGETQATARDGVVVTQSKKRKKPLPSKKAPSKKKAKPAAEVPVSVPDDSSESEDDELSEAAQYEDDAWKNFVHELLPRMKMGELKKMLAGLEQLAKEAYDKAMAEHAAADDTRPAAQKVVEALFDDVSRDHILDLYSAATKKD